MAGSAKTSGVLTAKRAGLVGCLHCGRAWPAGTTDCGRCGARLHSRFPNSMQRVWAWWIAGLIAYIPANLYPIMFTNTLGSEVPNTILGGVAVLFHHHAYFVGGVVFFASVMIPVAKFLAIAYLARAMRTRVDTDTHVLHKLYDAVEFIGRWSMIDVFVVAILSALVHLGGVADIFPGIAAACFALTVIFTMLSALALDPRLIWDRTEEGAE